jgi:hypothetical protein
MPRKRPRSPDWAPVAWETAPALDAAILSHLPGGKARHLEAIRTALASYATLAADKSGRQTVGVDLEELRALLPLADEVGDADDAKLDAVAGDLLRAVCRLSESARETLSENFFLPRLAAPGADALRETATALREAIVEIGCGGRPLDWAAHLLVAELGPIWCDATGTEPTFVVNERLEARGFFAFVGAVAARIPASAHPGTLQGVVKRYCRAQRACGEIVK